MDVAAQAPRTGFSARVAAVFDRVWLPTLTAICVVLLWQAVSLANWIYLPRQDFPAPTDIAGTLGDLARTSTFWRAIGETLKGWAVGLTIACLIGIPAGIIIGSWRPLHLVTKSTIEFLRPVPGTRPAALARPHRRRRLQPEADVDRIGVVWPLLIQSLYGVQDVDPVARDMARAYGLRRHQVFLRVVIPSALPYIVTGFRLSAILALNITIGIELLVRTTLGVGNEMGRYQEAGRVPEMWAYVVAAAFLGLGINALVRFAERRLLHWHPAQRAAVPL